MTKKAIYKNQIENRVFKVLKVIGFTILGISMAILFGFVVKWLWNSLLPDIFGIKEISYWQGVGILILGRILFGGFGASNNNKQSQGSIRNEVGSAIREDFHKGFTDGYYGKDHEVEDMEDNKSSESDVRIDNSLDDELYDKWWSEEGEKHFEAYMKDKIEN